MKAIVDTPTDNFTPRTESTQLMSVIVTELTAPVMRARLYQALGVYVRAMDYPRGIEHTRAPMWAEHILREGWRAVAAFDVPPTSPSSGPDRIGDSDPVPDSARLVGIAYGYRGSPAYWWDRQVRSAVRDSAGRRGTALMSDYFELTEIHVDPSAQGGGIGAALLSRLLSGLPESHVLLSTPEVPDEDNRAWRLYRRTGFEDLLRRFRFLGDRRDFAVLARALPLPARP